MRQVGDQGRLQLTFADPRPEVYLCLDLFHEQLESRGTIVA
jgi:hypothetical protein